MTAADIPRLSPQREAEIDTRVGAATPGSWSVELEQCDCPDGLCGHGTYVSAVYADGERRTEFSDFPAEDWRLAIHAGEDIKALAAELAAVRAERDEARAEVERLKRQRSFLLKQIQRKDARSGEADSALRRFLSGDDEGATS